MKRENMKVLTALLFFLSILSVQAQQQRLVVALDGSGDYTSIQAAVDAVRAFPLERVEIFIRNGVYREKIVVPSWKTSISFIGESKENTIIRWDDYSGKGDINTFTSYTVLVQGNGFRAKNITFENTAGPVGQAVALHVEADRCVFENCNIIGNQDTLYAGVDNSRQYYKDCYIEGTTDFIFGPATVGFENCTIHCKKNSYNTAASTPQGQDFGFVFSTAPSPPPTKILKYTWAVPGGLTLKQSSSTPPLAATSGRKAGITGASMRQRKPHFMRSINPKDRALPLRPGCRGRSS